MNDPGAPPPAGPAVVPPAVARPGSTGHPGDVSERAGGRSVRPWRTRAAPERAALTQDTLHEAFLSMGGEMLGFARKSLFDRGLADDVVQETFARAWRSRRQFDPSRGSLRTWLFAIERRAIIDLVDKQARTAADAMGDRDEIAVVDGLEDAIVSWQVGAALGRLHEDHRRVIHELFFNGRSGPEVAALLGIPEGTVRSRAFYALRSLRVLLNEEGWDG
jgi:RNA polymerase sigma-70 factor, ECF subfamily